MAGSSRATSTRPRARRRERVVARPPLAQGRKGANERADEDWGRRTAWRDWVKGGALRAALCVAAHKLRPSEAIPSEAMPSEASRGSPEALQAPFPPPGLELGASGWAAEKKWNLPGTYHGLTTVPSQNMIISYDRVQWIQTNYDPVWYPASVTGGSLPSSLPSPRTTWVELECLCQCRPPAAAPVSQHRSPTSAPTRSCARWITTATPSRRASHLGPPARSLNPGASTATLQSVSSTAATGARCTR